MRMSSRNLNYLLAPRSIALIGASERPQSIGGTVLRNLVTGGFAGPIWPVNRKYTTLADRPVYRAVADLPQPPDLAIVCTPPATIPGLVAEVGASGGRAAVVLTAGLETQGEHGRSLTAPMLEAAKPYLLRILGPNCLGVLAPRIGLNASFAHTHALPGALAFVSQSGALATAMLDWARTSRIGFSHFVSLGNAADVDFGDLLDYLASDPHTRAILLYVEAITSARKFMSAARAAARNKPVIAVKAGRASEGARAAATHTGALTGADDVYDAAFRRAGMLRVTTTRELFEAAESLARMKPLTGERLAIVSNGGGPAVLATDALIEGGGELAVLTPGTLNRLDAALPSAWSRANPVDIVGDAPAERYSPVLDAVLADPGVDATLLIHAPTAIVPSIAVARGCKALLASTARPVLTCWMGGAAVRSAALLCTRAGIPTYATPEEAVSAFLQVVHYRRNQKQLMEVPSSIPDFDCDPDAARAVITAALAQGRTMLTEVEAKEVLSAYGVPVVETRVAADVDEARRIAIDLGFPVAIKILSPDISHKSDVGGVALDIGTVGELNRAADAILARCRERRAGARVHGFTVQRMIRSDRACELITGVTLDPTFGLVVMFGQGGTAAEVVRDRAVALLPLNMALAGELVSRTRVSRLLEGFRDRPPVDSRSLSLTLVRLSQLATDVGEIVELDINPLVADETGVVALDARMRVASATGRAADRLAIRPYPKELEESLEFDGRNILLRPVRPEDFAQHRSFLERVTPEDRRTRFFHVVDELPERELARLTQIDYEREMAFIAEAAEAGVPQTLGVVRAHSDPDNIAAEFAILVRSDLKGRGLGSALLAKLIGYCRSRGTQRLTGEVLAENRSMLSLAAASGFQTENAGEGCVRVTLDLQRDISRRAEGPSMPKDA
jgi:acetyltransferase